MKNVFWKYRNFDTTNYFFLRDKQSIQRNIEEFPTNQRNTDRDWANELFVYFPEEKRWFVHCNSSTRSLEIYGAKVL